MPNGVECRTLHKNRILHLPSVSCSHSVSSVPPLRQRLIEHVEALSGLRPKLSPKPGSGLPVFLRSRYEIQSGRLFGRHLLLALEVEGNDPNSPSEYERQLRTLESHLGAPVVLVLPALRSYVRNRLVRKGIPFIVPGSQVFLPMTLIDLRERRSAPELPGDRKRLTPAAQCLVLYHLQRASLVGMPLKEIAGTIGYSPIMLTKVKAELESAGICESIHEGRAVTLRFLHESRELWDYAQPYFSSPIRKQHLVQWKAPVPPAFLSGISALSRLTMITDDPLPTFAMCRRSFRKNLEKGVIHGCPGSEEAAARLEAWSYDPAMLSGGDTVDRLSLHLSLRDSPDERVQKQLKTLIKETQW